MTEEEKKAKKAYLSQYAESKRRADLLMKSLRELRACSREISTFLVPDELEGAPSVAGRHVEGLDAPATSIAEELEKGICLRTQILLVISSVANKRQQDVLYDHFILGRSIADIAAEMHFCTRHIWNLYAAGLEAVELPPGVRGSPAAS